LCRVDTCGLLRTHAELRDATDFAAAVLEEGTDTEVSMLKSTIVSRLTALTTQEDWTSLAEVTCTSRDNLEMSLVLDVTPIEYMIKELGFISEIHKA